MSTPSPLPQPSRASERARLELARLPTAEPLDRVFRRACELCAEALGVERVGVWLFIDHDTALRCATLFERSKNEHSAGAVLRVADFPVYFRSLDIRKAVPAEVALSDPSTAELADGYLKPLGITSMLDGPIRLGEALAGVICCEHTGPIRHWTNDEEEFLLAVSAIVLSFLETQRRVEAEAHLRNAKKALETTVEERTRESRRSERRLQDLITSYPAVIYTI